MANENTTFEEIIASINSNANTLEEIANEIENLQKTVHSRNITVEDWNAAVTGLTLECGGLVANLKNLKDTISVTEELLDTKADTTDVDAKDTALDTALRNLIDQKVFEINTALASKANTSDVNTALDTKLDKFTTTENNVRLHGRWYNESTDRAIPASITPYGNRVMLRDGNGRSQVEAPVADKDIANKAYVDSHSGAGAVKSVNGVEPDEDGKLTLQASNLGAAPVVNGKIPSSYIPGSYDDVIEGYYYNLKFYADASHTTEITGESGKLYVDISTNKSYRYTGSGYTAISDFDPHTIIVQTTGTEQFKVMSQEAVTMALAGKQPNLTAGENITISGNTISAQVPPASVTSVNGKTGNVNLRAEDITDRNTGVSLEDDVSDLYSQTATLESDIQDLEMALDNKQNTLTAGANITFSGNTIAATVPVKGIKVGGVAKTPDASGNVDVPKATGSVLGVVKVNGGKGISIGSDGTIETNSASPSVIDEASNNFLPIVPGNLVYASKVGMLKNTSLTNSEKTTIKDNLGIDIPTFTFHDEA